MNLKLKELQNVAKETMKEERAHSNFRNEIVKALGQVVNVPGNHNYFASFVNDHLDVLNSTGRTLREGTIKVSTLLEVSGSKFEEVRKVAARLLPAKYAAKFLNDKSSTVRCAAASRLPYAVIKESIRFYPSDDQLRAVVQTKKLHEAGLPKPKEVTEPFDLYGEEGLGDDDKTLVVLDELPDSWYERYAHKLCADYGTNLEGGWMDILATRIAASNRAVGGAKIDRQKLLDAIYAALDERDEKVLEEGSLKAIAQKLRNTEYLDEAVMPILEEKADPVKKLLESSLSSTQYVEEFESIFAVKKSQVPSGLKKYRLGESAGTVSDVPMLATLPGGKLTSLEEKALDSYVRTWNRVQSLSGEPYRLSWTPHPMNASLVGFNLELK